MQREKQYVFHPFQGGGGGGGRRSGSPDAAFFELGSTLCILSVLSGKVTGT